MGNPNSRGQQRDKPFREALRVAIAEAGKAGKPKLRTIAEKLVEMAIDGDAQAIKEIADRVDGKVAQAVEIEGEIRHTIADHPMTHEEWAAQFTAPDDGQVGA